MTSDAKIGLLLGLVFIFIIAFLINGLPNSDKSANNNELTTNMAGLQNNPPGLAARERKAQQIFNRTQPSPKQYLKVNSPSTTEDSIRLIAPLPNNTPAHTKTQNVVKVKTSAPAKPSPVIVMEHKKLPEPELNKTALPRIYVVREGDNLAAIAKKFYGSENGNRRINITAIFKANRRLLKSPDQVYVGQKITIPPLPVSVADKNKIGSAFSTTMFKKVESTGPRGPATSRRSKVKPGSRYVVREGDSLWRIAAEQLGDASRYAEIARLNAGTLDDQDSLTVGMRLKIPAR